METLTCGVCADFMDRALEALPTASIDSLQSSFPRLNRWPNSTRPAYFESFEVNYKVWLRKGRKCDWSILEFDGHGHNADNAAYRDSVLRLPLRPPQVARRFIALSYEKLGIPPPPPGAGV